MAYTNLCGKKLQAKLGGCLNESATAHSPALLSSQQSFAKRQLEKMGWEEGTGLGKRRNGIQEHVKIKQREDEVGLGREKVMAREIGNVWWKDSVGGTLARLQLRQKEIQEKKREKIRRDNGGVELNEKKGRKEKRKKSSKKSGSSSVSGDDNSVSKVATTIKSYTDEELFQATGGARFGMRAQRRAEGKWKRTESASNIVELEKKAMTSIEWNGRGNAQVALVATAVEGEKTKEQEKEAATTKEEMCVTSSLLHTTTNKKRKRADDANANEGGDECEGVIVAADSEQVLKQKKKKQKKAKKERKSEKSSHKLHSISPSDSEGEADKVGTINTTAATQERKGIERKKEKKGKKSEKK